MIVSIILFLFVIIHFGRCSRENDQQRSMKSRPSIENLLQQLQTSPNNIDILQNLAILYSKKQRSDFSKFSIGFFEIRTPPSE